MVTRVSTGERVERTGLIYIAGCSPCANPSFSEVPDISLSLLACFLASLLLGKPSMFSLVCRDSLFLLLIIVIIYG